MLGFVKRLFGQVGSPTHRDAGPSAHGGPAGFDDPRQGDRKPHDPVPQGHNEALYSLLMILRHTMGQDQLMEPRRLAEFCELWGFDGAWLERALTTTTPVLDLDDLVLRLRDEFSPHDFEKTASVFTVALEGRELAGVTLRMLGDIADASGHGGDRLIAYLDEGRNLQRSLGAGWASGSREE